MGAASHYVLRPQGKMSFSNDHAAECPRSSANADREPSRERRDIQRVIDVWQQNVSKDGCPPLLQSFDFSTMKGDWGCRFLMCSDRTVENSAFIVYGSKFAQRLELPNKAILNIPMINQVPERYQSLFNAGCTKAIEQQAPARLSGSFKYDFQIEFYRAVFMPIMLHRSWLKQLIFGSFNSCTVLAVDQAAP
jgi:hypothetical protein